MNTLLVQISKNPLFYFRFMYNVQKVLQRHIPNTQYFYATTVDNMDAFTFELLQRHKAKMANNLTTIRNFMESENPQKSIFSMSPIELDNYLMDVIIKTKDTAIINFIGECEKSSKILSEVTLKKLFRHYSMNGKTNIVELLVRYSQKIDPYLYKRNGEFQHYLGKAQCMKGNSDKGLSILTDCYTKNERLRSFYRLILRELIQDAVLNKSEATLVIFRKFVLKFSDDWEDHYPLVCFWYMCWSSSWFSDQVLAKELLETSEVLRNIVRDKSTEFSINVLNHEYNEDAVVQLLQLLLQYQMMEHYVKVLQVLFGFKLKRRDIRGCSEIIRNCEVLGISLPSDQQSKYIKMLIYGKHNEKQTKTTANFKLKF